MAAQPARFECLPADVTDVVRHCAVCSATFAGPRNKKTCSPECRAIRTREVDRMWYANVRGPTQKKPPKIVKCEICEALVEPRNGLYSKTCSRECDRERCRQYRQNRKHISREFAKKRRASAMSALVAVEALGINISDAYVRRCKFCGLTYNRAVSGGTKFCSKGCLTKFRPEYLRRFKRGLSNCRVCGQPFCPRKAPHKLFCSEACYSFQCAKKEERDDKLEKDARVALVVLKQIGIEL